MALQTFTAGQVLTAAQVNALQANDYNQTVSTKTGDYVLVAADKGTRVAMNAATATTITVDTDLFNAGDTLFIQNIGAGVCTITAGTATVSTAGSLALAQNAGGTLYFTSTGVSIFFPTVASSGASALTLIKTETIGTTVASVTVTAAFSATYDAYKIVIAGTGTATSNSVELRTTLGASATGYYAGGPGGTNLNTNAAFWQAGRAGINGQAFNIDIVNPFLAIRTYFTGVYINFDVAGQYGATAGLHDVSTSFSAFTITPSTGTLSGGKIYVYGYQK